ncbi:Uncharacterized protein APZ42_034535 [Daphnia magna]|uniref:Uncharacterized protein n=1 Tax=Daphnia magna TaxID=35525 RepID=A0A162CAE7_9CRUS|nr:Uncharacterized protein APZ42_034535 [Daphnia magna]
MFLFSCKTMSCSDCANGLVSDTKTRYLDKLKLLNSKCPYSITNFMWKHGFHCYPIVPKISAPDIFIYLVETKNDKKHLEPIGLHTIVVAGHQFKLLYAKTLSSAPESSSGFRHIGSRRSKIHTTEQHYLEALGAYKGISSESQQAVGDGWVREFIAIALATQVVLMKANVSTSQALSESPHKPCDLHKI